MAYYWLPKRWRTSFERQFLSPKERKFIDAGERINKYPLDLLKTVYGSGPRRGGAQIIKSGKIPGDPGRRSSRRKSLTRGPGPVKRKAPSQPKTSRKKQEPSNKKRRTMPRSMPKYFGQGHYHGKFKKPRKRVKPLPYPVVQKTEVTGTETDGNCVYLTHTTHPLKYVLKTIGMTLVHKYFQQCGIHIRSFKDGCGVATGVGTATEYNLSLVAVYQDAPEGTSDPQFVTLATTGDGVTTTYESFAIQIADKLCEIFDTTPNVSAVPRQPFIHQLQWRCDGTSSIGTTLQSRFWDATEIRIAISGKSMVNLQNRTAAGDVADTTLTTSIYANPLHGKHYSLSGNGARVKHLGVTVTNTSAQFACSQSSGMVSNGALGTDVSAEAQDVLAQPPAGNYFYNCKKASYIRLEPGSIKQSTCYAEVTKSLNRWLRDMQPYLLTGNTLGDLTTFYISSLGESRIVALEKVADMASGNPITIGFERDGIMRGKLWFRKRRHTAALNSELV